MKTSVVAVAMTVATSHVSAQGVTTPAAQPIQKVYVTGSNIKRAVDVETSSPVQVINAAEIATIGASTVKDVLDTLTANTGALSDLGGGNSFASGASGVSLRNLGKNSTLTLLNGRRVSNYGLADGGQETFVNIDALPSEIIERVEILLDGASAVYGSDAVAGVINVITKKDFQGTTVRASARQSLLNSKLDKDQTASITSGFGDLARDGYNVFGHIEAYHRNPYTDREIEATVGPWYIKHVNPSFGVTSTFSYPGNFVDRYPTNYSDPALAGKNFTTPRAGCATIVDGTCRFDQYDRLGIHAEAERVNFYGGGRLNLSPTHTLYSEVTLAQTSTTYYNPPPIMQFTGTPTRWYSSKEGQLKFFTEPKLPVGHPDNPYSFPVSLRYRYADDVEMFKSNAKAKQYRVLVGVEGIDYGWDWNAAIGAMGSKVDNNLRSAKHAANYLSAVLTGEYRFGGKNSPELLNRMFPNILFGGESKQVFADIKASRELMQLPGGGLGLAVGADVRRDTFDAFTSDNVANAEVVGYGSIAVSGARNIAAAFAELNAPLTKQLEVNGALRVDKVGSTDASVVPKLSARYEVNKSFMLRGTVAHGFRAPNVAETGKVALSAFNNGTQDPKRCAVANQIFDVLKNGNTLDKADSNRARDLGCRVSFASSVQGNPELEPEKSRSFNAGFVLEPFKDLSLTMDYYHIERRNEIGTKNTNEVLANEDQVPGSVQRLPVTADDLRLAARAGELAGRTFTWPVGPVSALYRRYENLDKTRVSGVDMEINHQWNMGSAGRLATNVKANYQLDYRGWDSIDDAYTENLVGNYENYRYTVRAATNWKRGDWNVGGVVTYVPETELIDTKYTTNYTPAGCEAQGIPADYCRLKEDVLVNLNLSYSGIRNTTVSAYLNNVFNRKERIDMRAGNPEPRGTTLRLALEYRF
ncbi:TonB-dependent receptor [Massilia cavernae]|uniref:TonB-dependent receptor n=1 Tax=Massilia cavernae TaxID=2320864 RepID=A0A418XAS2_9BURK|nr:TonB-dependent receptor [Massilia cavernae]